MKIHTTRRTSHTHRFGFTLIELSVVMVIVALVLGGGMANFTAYMQKKGRANTQDLLSELNTALILYRQTYGRIPCPADITLEQADQNFGVENGVAGTCETAAAQNSTDNNIVMGMVPIRTLGLPDNMAFDSWGSRVMYYIDRRFSENGGFSVYGPDTSMSSQFVVNGDIKPVLALVSPGPNRHRAFSRAGGTQRNFGYDSNPTSDGGWTGRIAENSNAACPSNNWSCPATGTYVGTLNSVYFQNPSDSFNGDVMDDVVTFLTRSQMGKLAE